MVLCVCVCVCVCVCAEVITVLLFDCLLLQLYLISPTPVVPAAVNQFDIEVLSLANTSSVVITFSVSTPTPVCTYPSCVSVSVYVWVGE